MKVETLVLGVLLLPACGSGDDSTGTGSSDASSSDGSHPEAAAAETSTGDAANADAASDASDAEASTGPTDAAVDAGDAGPDAGPDAGGAESGDGACPGDWLDTTGLYSGVVPEAGVAILHAAGAGTQNYACETGALTDGGPTYTWTFVGPEATLDDCHATLIGHHFASDAGAAAPEWQTLDETYVIGSKKAAYTPDGGAASVPWLLLQATFTGGTGVLSHTTWVSRVNTSGGISPTTGCDSTTPAGTVQKVDYSADYYFWGP